MRSFRAPHSGGVRPSEGLPGNRDFSRSPLPQPPRGCGPVFSGQLVAVGAGPDILGEVVERGVAAGGEIYFLVLIPPFKRCNQHLDSI